MLFWGWKNRTLHVLMWGEEPYNWADGHAFVICYCHIVGQLLLLLLLVLVLHLLLLPHSLSLSPFVVYCFYVLEKQSLLIIFLFHFVLVIFFFCKKYDLNFFSYFFSFSFTFLLHVFSLLSLYDTVDFSSSFPFSCIIKKLSSLLFWYIFLKFVTISWPPNAEFLAMPLVRDEYVLQRYIEKFHLSLYCFLLCINQYGL